MKCYFLKSVCLNQLKLFRQIYSVYVVFFISLWSILQCAIYVALHLHGNRKMSCRLNSYRKYLQVEVNCAEQALKYWSLVKVL